MKIIGLTGGIGSGKSTVAGYFKQLGVPVFDSDQEAKKLMKEDKELRNQIMGLFGDEAYKGDILNREYIAERVFQDADLLERLNGLVHPAVRQKFKDWVNKQDAPYVIQEAAILFEHGAYKLLDEMILVWAPKELRIKRVMKRDSKSRDQVLARMANQWGDTEKTALSDHIIENIHLEETQKQVQDIHAEILNKSRAEGF
ncbi:MAG: dephospho-CoA kinase [Bacteroidia bacterium]|nr:dephospho-CoA kinase [Bacteroidia bacterium]